jgi:DNA (cytosine-5)-methyltransferase 1
MRHGSLFSGIGGFDLAAEWCGWENVFHCEWNEFGQKVLKHYWPNSESFGDITKTDFTKFNGSVDIISGGFPCQPYSSAGKRLGKEDERHLWPEMLRVIREVRPRYVVGENVFGLLNWNGGLVFDEVHADLAAEGYETQAVVIPAAAVNAPHGRDRVWFVAHSLRNGLNQRNGNDEKQSSERGEYAQRDVESLYNEESIVKHTMCIRQERRVHKEQPKTTIGKQFSKRNARSIKSTNWENFPTQSPICGGNDGLPSELDGITFSKWRNESIKAYGNAIVPQVAYEIFKTIDFINKQENA